MAYAATFIAGLTLGALAAGWAIGFLRQRRIALGIDRSSEAGC